MLTFVSMTSFHVPTRENCTTPCPVSLCFVSCVSCKNVIFCIFRLKIGVKSKKMHFLYHGLLRFCKKEYIFPIV